jgi:exodeoxyribonuclease X
VDLCKAALADLLELGGALALLNDPESLWRFSEDCRIPTRMTFGKHKGKLISEVDAGYVAWYRKQPDQDPYLLEAFRRVRR